MQKKLIAAAVVGALALPTLAIADSANVTISGDLRVSLHQYTLGEGDSASGETYYKENRVVDNGSRIIFSGTEDLGMGGLKAHFYIDNRLWADNGTGQNFVLTVNNSTTGGWGAGNVGIGVQSDSLGKFSLGRWDSLYVDMAAIELYRTLPLLHFLGLGPLMQIQQDTATTGTSTGAPATRIANTVWWDSPNWAGITARVGFSTNPTGSEGSGEASNNSSGGAYYGNVKYAGGPLVAGVSFYTAYNETAYSDVGNVEQMRAWVGYTFPFGLKVGFGFDKTERQYVDNLDKQSRTGWMVPVTYTMGAHNFYATYMAIGNTDDDNGDEVDDTGAKAFTVGWDMAMSKRTTVGVYYTKLDNEAAASYQMFGTGGTTVAPITGDTVPDDGESASVFSFAFRTTF